MVTIEPLPDHSQQGCRLGKHYWSVARLIALSQGFEPFTLPLHHLNIYKVYGDLTLRQVVELMKATQEASLEFPIILDEDGEIMDGRHRVMKALLEGKDSVLAVRFNKNPPPCVINE